MSADIATRAARYGYVVECPDGCRRHGGAFATDRAARRWADLGRCCTAQGVHVVHARNAPSLRRRMSIGGWT